MIARVPVDVGTFLLNEKRVSLQEIEERHKVDLIIVPQTSLESPHFEVQRVRDDDKETEGKSSFELNNTPEEVVDLTTTTRRAMDKPAVSTVSMDAPAPMPVSDPQKSQQNKSPEGLIKRIFGWLQTDTQEEPEQEKKPPARSQQPNRHGSGNRRTSSNNGNRRRSNQRRPSNINSGSPRYNKLSVCERIH